MRQFFYLVVSHYDETSAPEKVFLQEYKAVHWGRQQATKAYKKDPNISYSLFKQEITTNGVMKYVKPLYPYKEKGVDFDLDKTTPEAKRVPCYAEDIF